MSCVRSRVAAVALIAAATVAAAACGGSDSSSTSNLDVASPVTADKASGLVADGTDHATITIQLRGKDGKPLAGKKLMLTATGSDNTLTQPAATDAAGSTTATLASTHAESKTVSVSLPSSGGAAVPLSTMPAIEFIAGPAAKATFTTQPANIAAGAALPALTVSLEDAHDNVRTTATDMVTLALVPGTGGASDAMLTGTTSAPAVQGVATFSGVSANRAGTGFTITATAAGYSGATSSAFNVTIGAAAKLVITTNPAILLPASAGTLSPEDDPRFTAIVSAADAFDNPVGQGTQTVTVRLAASVTGATLSGASGTSAAMIDGVAMFSGLTIDHSGQFALEATATMGALANGSTTVPVAFVVHVGQGGSHFVQPTLAIHAGDAVHWVWVAGGHNVISGTVSGLVSTADNLFCSPMNMSCANSASSPINAVYDHLFETVGSFPYYCSQHAETGLITVAASM